MAIVRHQCPHCKVENMALQLMQGWIVGPPQIIKRRINTLLKCQNCKMPIAATLNAVVGVFSSYGMFDTEAMTFIQNDREAAAYGFAVASMWPEPEKPRVPDHLDSKVVRQLLQAERAFHRGDADAAVVMYGRTMELALKLAFPIAGKSDKRVTINQRIKTLVDNHTLPAAIGAWATEIRLIRNEAAHDDEPMEREDMIAIRNFTDAFLRYAITLPKEVELRRAETAPKGDAAPPQLPPPAA